MGKIYYWFKYFYKREKCIVDSNILINEKKCIIGTNVFINGKECIVDSDI